MNPPSKVFAPILCLAVALLASPALLGEIEWENILRVTDNIICTCGCPPTVLSACSCGRAGEMNREVRAKLEAGESDEEIYDFYVAQFGAQVLAAPRAEGFNLLGWIFPFVVLGLGAGVVVATYRRLRGEDGQDSSAPHPERTVDPRVRERIQRELADLD